MIWFRVARSNLQSSATLTSSVTYRDTSRCVVSGSSGSGAIGIAMQCFCSAGTLISLTSVRTTISLSGSAPQALRRTVALTQSAQSVTENGRNTAIAFVS